MAKTAVIIGSTGLTGSQVLTLLLSTKSYERVISFVRESSKRSHPKLIEHIIDFDHIESYEHLVEGDDFFCCIGTTMKKARSKEFFEKVDLHYPIVFAKLAFEKGLKQYLFISSIGADSKSTNFYLRTKGRCEDALKSIPFESLSLLRPSLLVSKDKEFRLMEKLGEYVMTVLGIFLIGKLKKYKPIDVSKVAYAMYALAQHERKGCHPYESDMINKLVAFERNEEK